MRESSLFPIIKAWLEAAGYAVMAEIPKVYADPGMIDVVGWQEGRAPVIVELKTGFTCKLASQARTGTLCTPFVYAAAPTRPSVEFLAWAHRFGFGVLRVGESVEVVQKPRINQFNPMRRSRYHKKFASRCREYVATGVHLDGTVGGEPCRPGCGPAQTIAALVAEYRKIYPNACWRELFQEIPNHYHDHNSMRGALRSRGLA